MNTSSREYEQQPPAQVGKTAQETPEKGLKGICGVAASIGDVNGELFDIEARYPDGAAAVRLGLHGVKTANVSYFPIDNENGEHIQALDSFYFRNGGLAGFKIHTNKGRVGEFSIDPLDEISRNNIHIESMFPEDRTIVGFCSRVGYRVGPKDLGVVCRASASEAPGS